MRANMIAGPGVGRREVLLGAAGLAAVAATGSCSSVASAPPAAGSMPPGPGGHQQVAVLIYPGFTALDVVGPIEVLTRVPGLEVALVAEHAGPVHSSTDVVSLSATHALADAPRPDVVLVSGAASGTSDAVANRALTGWLASVSPTARWTTSVCTGALLLGSAGLLRGRPATTHWAVAPSLARYGATYRAERVVDDDPVITAAGVSAGIDLALTLAGRLRGPDVAEAAQLSVEYAPRPPFTTGTAATASPHTQELARRLGHAADTYRR